MILSIWLDGKTLPPYVVDAVPRVGDILVLDRKMNVEVKQVVWSLKKATSPHSADLRDVEVHVQELKDDQ